jgi:predicted outer membrane protein
MKKSLILCAALVGLISAPALAQDKASQKFITEAIQGNFAEVAMGQLAQQNGERSDVKSYGQMLVTDHGAANQKAIEAAKARKNPRKTMRPANTPRTRCRRFRNIWKARRRWKKTSRPADSGSRMTLWLSDGLAL